MLAAAAAGCGAGGKQETESASSAEVSSRESTEEASSGEKLPDAESSSEKETSSEEASSEAAEEFRFVDAHGEWFDAVLDPDAPRHAYDWSKLKASGERLSYEDEGYQMHFGIDVSHHQGKIDWEKAAAAGVEFAIIRIAYRGYGESGNLLADKTAAANLDGAAAAGIAAGVYVFSQAINEEEAREEARFVLELLDGRELGLPVVFDPELIRDDTARTDDVTGEQFTANTREFCRVISEAGYRPMIYANMFWEAFLLDMTELADIPVWYADYEPAPQTPYGFEFWQYSESGSVPGIDGPVDLDVWFEKTSG
ncbi:MAG: glycoside hydrolase family 25 protein [Lachnospiraceae bacterium]|nr:glycoside hydrolase family 25 protein [Lachnospiraceae bacterium]